MFGVNAQKIGVTGGVNLASVDVTDNYEYGIRPGFNASVFFEKKIVPMIFVRPSLGYTQKGYTADILGADFLVNVNYANFDMDLKFKPIIIPLYVTGGIYTSYGMSGTYKVGSLSKDLVFGKNETNAYDFGISVGGGYMKSLTLLKLFIEAKYEIGTTDLFPAFGDEYKNRNIKINVGLMFGL